MFRHKVTVFSCCMILAFLSHVDRTRSEEHHHEEGRLDVFHSLVGDETVLSVPSLQLFIQSVSEQLECQEESNEDHAEHDHEDHCNIALCVNATDLAKYVGASKDAAGITEDQFTNASLVLLYYVSKLGEVCHSHVDVSGLKFDDVTRRLYNVTEIASESPQYLTSEGLTHLLYVIQPYMSHEHHDHNEEEDDDHDHNDDHADEHDHDHDHTRRRRQTVHSEDDEEHDHEGERHDHEDDHDHEGHGTEGLIVEEKCLSADGLLYYLGEDEEDHVSHEHLGDMASIVLFLIHEGSDIEASCRIVPRKGDFLVNLFEHFATGNNSMTLEDFEALMTKLSINPEDESHEEHAGHDHSRKRRSLSKVRGQGSKIGSKVMSRVKRQVTTDSAFSQCFSANQLAALYDSQSGISSVVFEQLCPALLSQAVFADCTHTETDSEDEEVSDAEKFGFGSIAVTLICLCSVFGVVFVTCATLTVYGILMSTMMGLAVGTLFADAVLHLIPMAMGIHNHGDEGHEGHNHDSDEIVVEEYVSYGVIVLGGLYAFYILETIMTRATGHTHSHGDEEPKSELKDMTNGTAIPKSEEDGDETDKPKKGLSPVALMIVLGDAIHNFADGLAIGAAFTSSVSTGVATSIAVFCHELPHELGDFAVLVQSGLSYKKAVFFNLLSSLTAFIGLYVGLVISDDEDNRKWIFALAAGMFMYISLVDLLPQLIKTRSNLHFLLNNLGILFGFGVMLIIAVFEEHIEV